MTCERIEKCANGEFCNYHVGILVSSCMNFKEKKEQINEEWFCSLTTEQKAYFLNNVADGCYYCGMKDITDNKNCPFGKCRNNPQEIAEWLKEKHTDGNT